MGGMSGMGSMKMNSSSTGFGDMKLHGLYKIWQKRCQQITISAGLSIPMGNIKTKGTTFMSSGDSLNKLPYNMQLGTGSFSIIPGINYIGQCKHISWGASAFADMKTGVNAEGYQWGNEYSGSGWMAYKCCKWVSASARMEYVSSGSIKGYDKDIAMMMNNDPTANATNYGGTHTNLLLGLNFYVPKGAYKGLRFGFEYLNPINQNMNGTQMSLKSGFMAGIQYSIQ